MIVNYYLIFLHQIMCSTAGIISQFVDQCQQLKRAKTSEKRQ
ncbi:protein of unknown function [Shewanella benthica]|uniref:Uncharacterized protein n=1 Tax=Shewanella benthica TaxID=43661 RepID=A0A330M4Z5_9GAMM|nr:protein of unknown function [Shewanella benthica]